MDNKKNTKMKSLDKALRLLEYFDADHKEAGVTELAEYSGLLKSSVYIMLKTFESRGYVTQNLENQKYMLGSAAVSLFSRYNESRNLDYHITQYLQELRDTYSCNACIAAKEKNMALYVCYEQIENRQDEYLSKVGAMVPLHCTAVGKILWGYSVVEEKNRILSGNFEKYTDNTVTDAKILKNELQTIIYQGYAVGQEEYKENLYEIAVPIITGTECVKYAIGLASTRPLTKYVTQNYIKALKDVSEKIAGILA